MPAIPTVRRVDHVACTVPDLDEAVAFFTRALGGALCYVEGPVQDLEGGDWMRRKLGVDPAAKAHVAMVRLGPVTNLELFAYQAPGQRTRWPDPRRPGAQRLALWVDDLTAATNHLRSRPDLARLGREWTMPPSAPDAGARWVDVTTSFGMPLRLWTGPDTTPPHHRTGAPRYRPPADWLPAPAPAVPGTRGLDHLILTVRDLAASVGFFRDVLGATLLHTDSGPYGVGAPPLDRAVLRLGPTDNLELHAAADPDAAGPLNSDVGGHHLAFYVDDVDAAVRYLRSCPGVEVMGEPETITAGPLAGDRWVYFSTPIGVQMEVLCMPDGSLPYERTTEARRAPGRPHRWTDRP